MTKEDWNRIRDQNDLPMEVWFEYYRERGGKLDNIEEFQNIFLTILRERSVMMGSDGQMKEVTIHSASRNLREHYDLKFGE